MATITTRAGKGSPLTNTEVDANFENLNTDKYESGDDIDVGTVTADGLTVDGNVSVDGGTINWMGIIRLVQVTWRWVMRP